MDVGGIKSSIIPTKYINYLFLFHVPGYRLMKPEDEA